MDERRCVPRWTVNREAQLQVEDHPNLIRCVVEDISTKGMRLTLGRYLFPEAFSNITVALGDALNFNVNAHVAWQEKVDCYSTYGLQFSNIDDEQRSKLEHFIDANFSDKEKEESNGKWWRGA
jgi:c-di-GMP-binding flagellar brake protein YcgR